MDAEIKACIVKLHMNKLLSITTNRALSLLKCRSQAFVQCFSLPFLFFVGAVFPKEKCCIGKETSSDVLSSRQNAFLLHKPHFVKWL